MFRDDGTVPCERIEFPIPDYGAPADRAAFYALASDLVARLRAGSSVLVHGHAGIGRTGTLTACVLILLGHSSSDAIAIASKVGSSPVTQDQDELVAWCVERQRAAPPGWRTITPRIVVPDSAALVDFITSVFGASGDVQPGVPAVLSLGDSRIMVSDAGARARATAFLYVYVDDADETYRRAIAAGTRSIEEPRDVPYGDRRGMVQDAWGNTWQIATPLRRA